MQFWLVEWLTFEMLTFQYFEVLRSWRNWSSKNWKCGTVEICVLFFCYVKLKSNVDMLFFECRRSQYVPFQGNVFWVEKQNIHLGGGTEPPFRVNLLFGYAQSGSERTSFSGSTVTKVLLFWIQLIFCMSCFRYIANDPRIPASRLGL